MSHLRIPIKQSFLWYRESSKTFNIRTTYNLAVEQKANIRYASNNEKIFLPR